MEGFRITPESRGENLHDWKPEQLQTLRERLANEVEYNLNTIEEIDRILAEKELIERFNNGRSDN